MVTGGEDEEGAISDPGSEMMEESSEQVKVTRTTAEMFVSAMTVNHKYFIVKIFSDSLACANIKRAKIHTQY